MYREEYYDYSSKEGKMIKDDLKSLGLHHLTISSLPADFFRMSKSQLEKLFEHASDAFIARMYDVPQYQVEKRRGDFGIKQLGCTLNRMERKGETAQIFKEILRIVSNEYNNGNIPHTNSTPLNSEKELIYMKATGIVRRIDDLGRVVIPKEIRRTLRLKEGTPLEIYTDREGEVILKKYSPMAELGNFAKQYADSMAGQLNCSVAICDRDQVIAAAGPLKKELLGQNLSFEVEQMIMEREYTGMNGDTSRICPVYRGDLADYSSQLVYPIICEGDAIGAVVLVEREAKARIGETEQKAAAMAASFLGSQMEG